MSLKLPQKIGILAFILIFCAQPVLTAKEKGLDDMKSEELLALAREAYKSAEEALMRCDRSQYDASMAKLTAIQDIAGSKYARYGGEHWKELFDKIDAWMQQLKFSWSRRCEKERQTSLGDAVGKGLIAMAIQGRDKTTAMAMRLTNKTEDPMSVVVPTGTPLEPDSEDCQPYQTGYIPPIDLGPGETKTVEVPAFCTDSEKKPAPADGSVAYTLHEDLPTPQQEKITELIVTTNQLRQFYSNIGPVAEPDDFLFAGGPPPLTVPTPEEVPKPSEPYGPPEPEPEVYGPPPPPEKPEPEVYGPPPPPEKPEPEEEDEWPLPPPGPTITPEEALAAWGQLELVVVLLMKAMEDLVEWYYEGDVPPLYLEGRVPLTSKFLGTTEFTLKPEGRELKTEISSKDEKGEAVFSNPTGKVEVALEPTENPEIVKFNITKVEARSPSFEALGKSRGNINIALNSPEKSTGTLNIKTGEVKGTVSAKAWGKEYKEPFPAAATYTGKFDVPTGKLSLNLRGVSFEPVEIPQGPYEKANPEKFWESVQLYTIWRETNKIGKKELSKLMEEQFREKYPAKKAKKLGEQVTKEIIGRVDKVYESHKELKEEGIDFSTLDPTLKWRKT